MVLELVAGQFMGWNRQGRNGFLEEVSVGGKDSWQSRVGWGEASCSGETESSYESLELCQQELVLHWLGPPGWGVCVCVCGPESVGESRNLNTSGVTWSQICFCFLFLTTWWGIRGCKSRISGSFAACLCTFGIDWPLGKSERAERLENEEGPGKIQGTLLGTIERKTGPRPDKRSGL